MRDKEVDATDFVRPAGVDIDATLTVIRVPREWERWRLDRVVHATFPRMSRTRAQGVVSVGAYCPTGRKLRGNDRMRFGQVVLLYRPPFEEPDLPTHCPVVYEDDALLAIDKPPGLPVHPTARYHHRTVTAVLAARYPGQFLALCHRIDRETSGVLLLAKTRSAERIVKRALADRTTVRKHYLAITRGVIAPRSGRMAFSLKLDDNHRYNVKMRVADGEEGAREAATRYDVVDVRYQVDGTPRALVACELETGRQHQIRAHLAASGTPIVGDKLYGPDDALFGRGADGTLTEEDLALLELPRHALHAHRMTLPHPLRLGEHIDVVAQLPADLADYWNLLAIRPMESTHP